MANPILRLLLLTLASAAVLTVIGMVALWPDGSGRRQVLQEASEIGLLSERYTATVEWVIDETCSFSTPDNEWECRTLIVVPDDGPDAGAVLALPEFVRGAVQGGGNPVPDVADGDAIVIDYEPTTGFYSYGDKDRRTALFLLVGLFAALVVVLGRSLGVLALLAMATTIVVLVGFVAPAVLDGHDPVLVSVVAASAIAFFSLYLTHGVTPTTTVALIGTLLALALTLAISSVFFALSRFTGLATEEGLVLPVVAADINLASLLLGGAMIGALGALDDVTVTQVATVAELRTQNQDLSRRGLFAAGIRVGREHIAATVNTLLLAYVGVSMPLLLLFVISNQSLIMIANSELVAVEIVRTLCGSIGLIAAVPITTWLTALLVSAGAPSDAPSNAPSDGSVSAPSGVGPDARSSGSQPVECAVEPASEFDPAPPVDSHAASAPRVDWDDFRPEDRTDLF